MSCNLFRVYLSSISKHIFYYHLSPAFAVLLCIYFSFLFHYFYILSFHKELNVKKKWWLLYVTQCSEKWRFFSIYSVIFVFEWLSLMLLLSANEIVNLLLLPCSNNLYALDTNFPVSFLVFFFFLSFIWFDINSAAAVAIRRNEMRKVHCNNYITVAL